MDTTIIHRLEAGQSLLLRLRRGDRLWMQQGSLHAEPPAAWLGGVLVRRQEQWPEGRLWTADASAGWQCRAPQQAMLCVQRRLPWWRRWLGGLSATAAPAGQPPAAPRPSLSAAAARCAGTPAR